MAVVALLIVIGASAMWHAVLLVYGRWGAFEMIDRVGPVLVSDEPARFLFADFSAFFAHAERVRLGETLYWPWPEYGPHVMTDAMPEYPQGRMPYPPFLTPALSLISGLGFVQVAVIWYVLLFAGMFAYTAALSKLATGAITLRATLVATIALLALPDSHIAFKHGNIDPIIWAVFGAALTVPLLRGAGFAGIALIKLYGVWPLLFAWRREGRRVVGSAAIVIAGAVLMSAIILGASELATALFDWARYMLPVVGQGTFKSTNVSLSFAGLRLLREAGWEYTTGPLPVWARLYLTAAGIAAPLLVGRLTQARSVTFQCAAVTCAAVLFGPLCWLEYLPLLLAPAAILYRERTISSSAAAATDGGSISLLPVNAASMSAKGV